jgi:hypothetical protein
MSLRIWLDQMDPQQFEDISSEIQSLHQTMKNMMEVVFATSPLLALSTHGWDFHVHRTYLLRVSGVLVLFLVFIYDDEDIYCTR